MTIAGGLVPVLLGRQINRVIPQFVILLPPSSAHSAPGYSRGRFAVATGEHCVGDPLAFAAGGNVNLPVRNAAFTADLERVPPPTIDDPAENDAGYLATVGSSEGARAPPSRAQRHARAFAVGGIEEARPMIGDEFGATLQTSGASSSLSRSTMWRRSKRRIKKFVSSRLEPRTPKSSRMLCQVCKRRSSGMRIERRRPFAGSIERLVHTIQGNCCDLKKNFLTRHKSQLSFPTKSPMSRTRQHPPFLDHIARHL